MRVEKYKKGGFNSWEMISPSHLIILLLGFNLFGHDFYWMG
jgi:hypothetical protein